MSPSPKTFFFKNFTSDMDHRGMKILKILASYFDLSQFMTFLNNFNLALVMPLLTFYILHLF